MVRQERTLASDWRLVKMVNSRALLVKYHKISDWPDRFVSLFKYLNPSTSPSLSTEWNFVTSSTVLRRQLATLYLIFEYT